MQIDVLTVYAPNGTKERLGKDFDGGYVIVNTDDVKYDKFISCGIESDVSFENALLNKYPYLDKCYGYDGTISDIPANASPKIEYIRKNIGGINSDTISNLHNEIVGFNNIFLKADIEGSEFELFASMNEQQMRSFKQIAIEIHWPVSNEFTWSILGKLQQTHWLVHLHVNSHCGLSLFNTTDGKVIAIPNVGEFTYIRKDGQVLERSSAPIPNPLLDQTNVIGKEEIVLKGYPYNTL